MRGPKDLKDLGDSVWIYNYTKRGQQKWCKFSNLGMALLISCDKNKDSQVRAVLATLLQNPYSILTF